ncbi:6-phosphogluconolactonase [Marimonas arenosa]|uniref:6-phosphogluconolactonase n=1 Tax=Marimonas arenosa TaxID=1795305 RepID=A0AAE3W9Q9_9RHOB|nr:6-phosphogluconolactonase [Marimonas arenosa]MDQ2088485.1 6-phosphogluconolactonase [Marimonas arenosa]
MNIIDYADADLMALDVAQLIAGELEDALMSGGRATLAVPGGETPGAMFDDLSGADLDWDRVDVMLTDERWLPEVHVRSNARQVKERLLTDRAAAARFHPLYAPAERPDDVLADIEAGLVPCLPITVALIGMGTDMHVASLFPGGDNLATGLAAEAPILVPMQAPGLSEARVSLTARVLNGALSKHLMITGNPKRNALEKAAHMSPEDAPVAAILEDCTVHWAP